MKGSGYEEIGGPRAVDGFKQKRKMIYGAAAATIVVLGIWNFGLKGAKQPSTSSSQPQKLYDEFDRFIMEDYDTKPPFASFLPAIAGLYGKPVWAFYTNRAQGVTSFGTLSKEYPMLEFNAANKAYQSTPYVGFRTFIKGSRKGKSFMVEPFSPQTSRNPGEAGEDKKPKRIMYVGTNEMEVKDIDSENGITVNSTYIVLPMETFSSLVRRTTYTNTGDSDLTFSALDGVARFEPDGGKLDWSLKNMGRTLEGWMGVHHAEDSISMPFFKLSTEPSDAASVHIEMGGHYCLSFVVPKDGAMTADLLPIAFDPRKIFGWDTTMTEPDAFKLNSVTDIITNPQYGDAKTSSAMSGLEETTLAPGESITVATFYGKADNIDKVPEIAATITKPGYVMAKFDEARTFVDEMLSGVETRTADHLFNGAVKQMYLDNSLRGGLATVLGDVDDSTLGMNADENSNIKIFHAYSRIHGDLERDYNKFVIDPTYFSQGPGNYRDVAQNRRNDVFFLPRIGSFDVQLFLGFIQADGYEPMSVESVAYRFSDAAVAHEIADKVTSDETSKKVLTAVILGGPFRPGQLFGLVEQLNINLSVDDKMFINTIVGAANQTAMAVYETGYWADHWEYYLDLIESYTAVYPDGEEALMYDKELKYFFSPATCKPRSEKYILTLTFDGKSKHVLQLDATAADETKAQAQQAFLDAKSGVIGIDADWQFTSEGEHFTSNPISKLFLLGAMKFATRDAYGMGVEYEGGRPGWNDAMNGLVGMVGSGMPETFEMYQLLEYVNGVVGKYQRPIVIPEELGEMIDIVNEQLKQLDGSEYTDSETFTLDVPDVLFNYWNNVATAREEYREKVKLNFSGVTRELSPVEVNTMLSNWLTQVEMGIARAMKVGSDGFGNDGQTGVPPSYFSYNVTSWELNGGSNAVGLPTIDPKAMSVGNFPLFLEGPTRYMKTIIKDKKALRDIYNKVLVSGLRDKELNMYFLSASLEGQSYDMGRMMAFAPGWLENQSIWMHMSYKYYLELLRGGLYEEFFSEMKGGGMLPYMDAERYGRSLMECSSFLASSAFPDPSQHGRGFSARLSGSTAEFLSMWRLMFVGPNPFIIVNESLNFQLVPAIPIWLFAEDIDSVPSDQEVTLSYKLFASIEVTYHNSQRTDIYGISPNSYMITFKDGTTKKVDGPTLDSDDADAIRRVVTVDAIDAYF